MYLYTRTSKGNKIYIQQLINGIRIRVGEGTTKNNNWFVYKIFNNFELTILK